MVGGGKLRLKYLQSALSVSWRDSSGAMGYETTVRFLCRDWDEGKAVQQRGSFSLNEDC